MARPRTMIDKLKDAAPYNIFYNTIPELPATSQHPNSITFADLLCPSLGELKCSLQITGKFDIEWLIKQYEIRNVGSKPLTILYTEYKPQVEKHIETHLPNVTHFCVPVKAQDKYGSHHAKLGIYVYEDKSLRIVISTSNLYQNQWDHFNHGFWVSPQCPHLSETAPDDAGESPTNFKSDLLNYLNQYNQPSVLDTWVDYIKRADFSDVKVFLVTSVPGSYPPETPGSHLQQVTNLLRQHCKLPPKKEKSWPVIAQASCLGHYGESPKNWLGTTFLEGLVCHHGDSQQPEISMSMLKIIYPTWKQVKTGHFKAELVGDGLRYLRSIHNKQQWIKDYLYQWKASGLRRSTIIMPHTKTYCRVSPCWTKMAWFLLTTGNVNRGAWGQVDQNNEGHIYVRNYEVGVMFFPQFFDEEYFQIKINLKDRGDRRRFPLMYDLPLLKYREVDHPWSVFKIKNLMQKRFSTDKDQK